MIIGRHRVVSRDVVTLEIIHGMGVVTHVIIGI
jgi:hypothetical protein